MFFCDVLSWVSCSSFMLTHTLRKFRKLALDGNVKWEVFVTDEPRLLDRRFIKIFITRLRENVFHILNSCFTFLLQNDVNFFNFSTYFASLLTMTICQSTSAFELDQTNNFLSWWTKTQLRIFSGGTHQEEVEYMLSI